MRKPLMFAAALVATSMLHVPDAAAVEVLRSHVSQAVANCQSALPVFDGLIRKRPKALANEGTANAFVTCGFEGMPNSLGKVRAVAIHFLNRGGTAVPVNCTLVQGVGDVAFHPAITKSLSLAPGQMFMLGWTPEDNGDEGFALPALSCNLRPGVEISGTTVEFVEDVGA